MVFISYFESFIEIIDEFYSWNLCSCWISPSIRIGWICSSDSLKGNGRMNFYIAEIILSFRRFSCSSWFCSLLKIDYFLWNWCEFLVDFVDSAEWTCYIFGIIASAFSYYLDGEVLVLFCFGAWLSSRHEQQY